MSKISSVVAEIIAEMTYEFFKKREVTKRTPKIIKCCSNICANINFSDK